MPNFIYQITKAVHLDGRELHQDVSEILCLTIQCENREQAIEIGRSKFKECLHLLDLDESEEKVSFPDA